MAAEDPNHNPSFGAAERRRRRWGNTRAGLLRLAFGVLGVFAAEFLPALSPYRLGFVGYLGLSLLFQLLIRMHMGRMRLIVAMGAFDVVYVTFLVQVLGSTRTVVSFLYLLIPIVFATTTSRRRISMILAGFGSVAYVTILMLEWFGVLRYAPAVPGAVRPSGAMVFFSGLVVTLSIMATTRFVSQLIAALREANGRLRDQSERDELTALYNRRYLLTRLSAELSRVQRGGTLNLLMVDLDGFKRVNDEEGHEAGDKVLDAVGQALLGATRRSDVVARYGGDEFVVLLPDTGPEGCQAVAARIVDHARDVGRQTFPACPVTASVGIASATAQDDPTSLIRRADEGVYAAKRGGGDRSVSV
ncbi:MAG TPA: GGDEF domain-containing protein [Polyangiales bacterium]